MIDVRDASDANGSTVLYPVPVPGDHSLNQLITKRQGCVLRQVPVLAEERPMCSDF